VEFLKDTPTIFVGLVSSGFAGTAEHNLRYRFPYPSALLEEGFS
jgi:hypothetical protein